MKSGKASTVTRRSATSDMTATAPEALQPYLEEIQRAIARRAHELFEARGGQHGHDRDDWFRAETELLAPVSSFLTESGDALSLRVNIAGFKRTEIKASVEPRRIVLLGRSQASATARKRAGNSLPSLMRSVIDLAVEINPRKTSIQFKTGTLTFELPKNMEGTISTTTEAA
jgi:HSP20 family molecular chaperone IbpA